MSVVEGDFSSVLTSQADITYKAKDCVDLSSLSVCLILDKSSHLSVRPHSQQLNGTRRFVLGENV